MNPQQLDISQYTLHRFPVATDPNLQAWDSADEYLLQKLAEDPYAEQLQAGPVVIFNDTFGALSCALASLSPVSVSDSFLGHEAARRNFETNELPISQLNLQNSLTELPQNPSVVIIKLPKTLALLEDQLIRLQSVVSENTLIVAAAKAKDIHTSTLSLFESILGTTTTSLAWKKSRLIFCKPEARPATVNPYPTRWKLEKTNYQISNHSNVFSRSSLDIGARFFLEHLPSQKRGHLVDLGCGNGVLGLVALEKNPEAQVTFIDESFMAIASAQANIQENRHDDLSRCHFLVGHSLSQLEPKSVDVILCNPPFHQLQTITDEIAWQMFKDAKRCLTKGGELWIVGNRHLGHHQKLKRLFGGAECVASNNKFVILRSINR